MKTTKFIVGASAFALAAAGLTACSSERTVDTGSAESGSTASTSDTLVGIAMPTKSLERWNRDGSHLESLLKDAGYQTSLQYADNKVDQQITQIENMITQGADVLVVASIDGTALDPVLSKAAAQKIPVIAYDRLLNETDAVDYYVTFDNYKVGQIQGEFIKEKIGDLKAPIYLEPFAGSPDDNNARYFFSGAWDVLQPLVQDGTLEVRSGKAPKSNEEWQSIGILGWDSADAQSEMENRLNSFYTDGEKVDIILSPNDSLALGIAQALEGAGYTPGDAYPVLTGQDCDAANVKNLLAGKQSMCVFKNTEKLGDQVAKMVDQVVKGEEPEINDTETYDNGRKVVPTYLLTPETVTADTYQKVLIDSGYYTAADLGL
ncbi:multiple monosaccharide ABC transporter substrate-binding protein [Schaalia vaccimaxillae]|uniref:multiple monosaccharide ABC transporter substrate-binding protein n=1 Tax=Schaalia vaccimaxillae TaxID=183916 RepID=UPI0003B7385B|nr:multiple monosaccharide ABC transporter substrate-binding protein [Schaalia vaccimaxillae]